MPKRIGYLYEKIYDWSNLLNAYHKAGRSKKERPDVLGFEFDLENQLVLIQRDLKAQAYRFEGYHKFNIYEPKERTIHCAPFRDRVVHHAISNILNPILDRSMIPDTYACRNNKGLHRALKRAFYFYRNSRYCYKFDVRKFFYTIDHEILMRKVSGKIKDPKLLNLLRELLNTYDSGIDYYFRFEQDDLIDMMRNRGLPIGNLTSQIFGNFFLSDLDHFIKEDLRQRSYIRYMDDALVFAENLEELKTAKSKITNKLAEDRLFIHPDKNIISNVKRGINFLGFRFFQDQIRLQNKNLVRFKKKLKKRAQLNLSYAEHLLSLNGHLGFISAGNTFRITEIVLSEVEFNHNQKKYSFTLQRV
jgi:retron-type reverse transcriptase